MQQQFELLQVNKSLVVILQLGGLIIGIGMTIAGLAWLPYYGFWWVIILMTAAIWGGLFTGVVLSKKCSIKPISLILTGSDCTIIDKESGRSQTVAFSAIKSYRVSVYHGSHEMHLNLQEGRTLRLDAHTWVNHLPTDVGIVQAIEKALQAYQMRQLLPKLPREKTFFEKPIARLVPMLATIGAVYAGCEALHGDASDYAALLKIAGSYISFLGVWLAAARIPNTVG